MTDRAHSPSQPIFRIYPSTLHKVKVAWLSSGNGVGFEVFEFIDPPHKPSSPRPPSSDSFDFARAGFFHIAVTAPDPEEVVTRAVQEGGRQVGEMVGVGKGGIEKAGYVCDPWGNVVEVLSCSFEGLLANSG